MNIIQWEGEVITEPGLYSGVPLHLYHSQKLFDGPSVSSSNLRRALEINRGSPAHMYAEWSGNPDYVEKADNEALVLGRAAHHLTFGIDGFGRYFAIRPAEFPDYRSKAAREWRDEMRARGFAVLTDDNVECIKGMKDAMLQHPLLHNPVYNKNGALIGYHGMLDGEIELSMFWRDEETGLWCKARPDAVPNDSGYFADLKTTTSVSYEALVRTITEFAYHQQAALVGEGARRVAGIQMELFSFVFVEKTPPYCVRVVQLKDEDLVIGEAQNHSALRLIARCFENGHWPGPGDATTVDHIAFSARYREAAQALIADEKQTKEAYRARGRDNGSWRRANQQ